MGDSISFDPIAEARRQWTTHWGAAATPAMSAVTSIMRAEQILTARLNQLLKPFELTFPRYEALMLLYYSRNGALPLGKMGARLQVHRTSVTNIVDGLEQVGYVSRERPERDRRTILASITKLGRRTAKRATQVLNKSHFGTAPLTKAELEVITSTLEDLRADEDGISPGASLRSRVPQ